MTLKVQYTVAEFSIDKDDWLEETEVQEFDSMKDWTNFFSYKSRRGFDIRAIKFLEEDKPESFGAWA